MSLIVTPCSGGYWLADRAKSPTSTGAEIERPPSEVWQARTERLRLSRRARVKPGPRGQTRSPLGPSLNGHSRRHADTDLPAKTCFSRGAAKSRKARTLIGRNRSATYKRLIGTAGGWNSSSTVVKAPSSWVAAS